MLKIQVIEKPDDETILRLARLEHNNDAQFLLKLLKSSNEKLNKILRKTGKDDIQLYQGAGQCLDEVIELFEKASECMQNIKK